MKESKSGCDLKTCFMCRYCLADWHPAIRARKKNYELKKGDVLFHEGEEVKGIYFLFSGRMKVHKQWGEDKELIVRFAREGDIVGHRGLGSDNIYPVSCTALESCKVCFADIEFFHSTLNVNTRFLYELMLFYAAELKESEKHMRNLAHMPVKGRIIQALLSLEKKFGRDRDGNIDVVISRQDLASYAGTTYETCFRMLNELVNDHMITTGKKISILNPDELVSLPDT